MDIHLEAGIRAYPVELREKESGITKGVTILRPPTVEEAKLKLNALFQSIADQGGDIMGFVAVDTGPVDAVIGDARLRTTTFVIVEWEKEEAIRLC